MEVQSFAENQDIQPEETYQLIVFKLAGQAYALLLEEVREVVLTPILSKVPLTPNYLAGVANIRGNIFAVFDLEKKLALAASEKKEESYTLVLEDTQLQAGVLVNEVPRTLEVNSSQINFSPELINAQNMEKEIVKGIVKEEEDLIILLYVKQLINFED